MIKGLTQTRLGIHLNNDAICIVESVGREIKRYCRQELAPFGVGLSEVVEDEIKFAAILQKMLRENDFASRDTSVALPAQDAVVRFFEIPPVSKKELATTVNFEARKYIPFRIEELMYDFMSRKSKNSKSLDVIFVAVKKRLIDRYLKVFNQVGFNILSLEPASLSFLRTVFSKARINIQKASLIVDIDANFLQGDIIIIESGIPCFIRDITIAPITGETTAGTSVENSLSKLINEIRISIDYFRHHYLTPKNNISNILLFSDSLELDKWSETISQELGLACSSFSSGKILHLEGAHCDLLKADGAALRGAVGFPVDLSLIKKEEKTIEAQGGLGEFKKFLVFKPAFKKLAISLGLALFIIISSAIFGNLRISGLEKKLAMLKAKELEISFLPKDIDLQEAELVSMQKIITTRLSDIQALIRSRISLTDKIGRIPLLMPDSVWLERFNFQNPANKPEMFIYGIAYLPEPENELKVINQFLNNLRLDTQFKQGFNDTALSSVQQSMVNDFEVRNFEIRCR